MTKPAAPKHDTLSPDDVASLQLGAWRSLPVEAFGEAIKNPPYPLTEGPLRTLLGDLEREHVRAVALRPYQAPAPVMGRPGETIPSLPSEADQLHERAELVRAALKELGK